MSFYVQVLCTEGIDSSACIAVFTESHRFLFNCGEGIQRLCVEHKVRLSKIRAVMFTDFSPQNVFGLPGLSLTAADAGNNNIRVAGPTQLKSFLNTTRHFMKLPDGLLNFHTSTEQSSCIFNSSEVDLRMISFDSHSADNNGSRQRNCFVGRTPELKGKFDLQKAQALNVPKGPLFGKLKNGQSITLVDGTVIHPDQVLGESELSKYFIVVCSVLPQEEELMKYITSNTELNRFQTGQVDRETGGMLHCMVHLSSKATVNTPLYQTWVNSFGPLVTHIYTGAGTSATTHSSFIATTTTCNKMHVTTPELFPSMHNVYTGLYDDEAANDKSTNYVAAVPLLKFHLLPVRSQGVEFPAPVDCSAVAQALYNEVTYESAENATKVKAALTQMEVVKDVLTSISGVVSASARMDTSVESTQTAFVSEGIHSVYGSHTVAAAQLLHSGVEGKISFLGTGCSIPSKYRNVSGILLQLNNSGDISSGRDRRGAVKSLLIDAGEGTWAQMQRLAYEAALTSRNTVNSDSNTDTTTTLPTLLDIQFTLSSQLWVVWVSHPHADHHLGLVRVIIERKMALLAYSSVDSSSANISVVHSEMLEPLVVIAPPSVLAFLHEYSLLNPTMQDAYIGVSCRAYDPDDSCVYTDCYWNKTLIERNDSFNNCEATDEQEHKRMRTHSPDKLNPLSITIDITTSATMVTDSIAVTTKPDDIPHKKHLHGESNSAQQPKKSTKGYQYFIDTGSAPAEGTISATAAAVVGDNTMISDMLTDTTISTICGMNEVNNIISTSTVPASTTAAPASAGNKTWRNFKHIFKEQIPAEVLALASEAKIKADRVLQQMGIVELTNVQVVHCGQSYGLSITIIPTSEPGIAMINDASIIDPTSAKPIKLVYSGDTRPCPRLIEIGADATILIHEATFEDTKQEEAMMKRHSTMSEAYQVGVEMKSFRTIFTHFSQRYPGVPLLAKYAVDNATTIATSDANAESISDAADSMAVNTTDVNGTGVVDSIDPILAFDYMQLSFKDLLWAPASTAVYSAAFPGKTTVSKGGEADEE